MHQCTFDVLRRGTKLIGQCGDRDDLDDEIGMRKRHNPDDLRGRRIVFAAVLGAMLSEEFVQHVLTEVGGTHDAASGKRSFHEERELDRWSSEVPRSSRSDLMFASM